VDASELLVEVEDVHKSFSGVRALRGASLTVRRGETLGLVGPNGAGKSTLVNVIAGVLKPDSGVLKIAGEVGSFSDPMQAKRKGVLVVPQEVQLFPGMSASANLSAGLVVRKRSWFVNGRRDQRLFDEICERLGVQLRNERQIGFASPEAQRLIMVGQAVLEGAKVLILDEPTAGLSPRGCEVVYTALETMRKPDMAVIYVTHKFDEVSRLCDRAAVVVDGVVSNQLDKAELTREVLSAEVSKGAITLDREGKEQPRRARVASDRPSIVLRGASATAAWEVPCHRGSITALAGLVDSGAQDVLRAVSGQAEVAVEVSEDEVSIDVRNPRAAALAGISYVGGHRRLSSFPGMSVATNIGLSKVRFGRGGLTLSRAKERALTAEALTGVGLDTDMAQRALGTLSGGNQQRSLFARQAFVGGRLLVVDDPTVGVDVSGRARIHAIIRAVADQGYGVLLYSSDPDETVELADDIYV
jgi:ABC-type sugar transport system ATPase subunit